MIVRQIMDIHLHVYTYWADEAIKMHHLHQCLVIFMYFLAQNYGNSIAGVTGVITVLGWVLGE